MKGFLYIRTHYAYDKYDCCKLGITINIPNRDNTYATGEVIRGKFVIVYEVDAKLMAAHERILQYEFNDFKEYHGSGTEFYNKQIIGLFETTCKRNGIKILHKLSDSEIVELRRTAIAQDVRRKIKKHNLLRILNKKQLQIKHPKNYQLDVLDKCINHYKDNVNAILQLICGFGKTLTSLWLAERLKSNKILVGLPNLHLLNQWMKEIKHVFPHYNILMVKQGITTEEIKKFINSNMQFIILTTYASAWKIAEISNLIFDIKIADEMHHLTCRDVESGSDKKSYIKFLDIPCFKQLGLTATLKEVQELDNLKVISNRDETIFGKVIAAKNLLWGIQNNVITDYVIQILHADSNYIDSLFDNFNITCDIDKKLFISAYTALCSINNNDSHHMLIYCNEISNANKLNHYVAELIKHKYFTIDKSYCNCFHSEKDGITNNPVILDNFSKSKTGIIICIYGLGEGWDFPLLDAVLFAENMTSNIRILQSALRANRLNVNELNKVAKYILPMVYGGDWLNDASNDYKNIREIIYQIGLEDETIIQKIKAYKLVNKENKTNINDKQNQNYSITYDDTVTNNIKVKTLNRMSLDTTYVKAKQINKHYNIRSIKEYNDYCSKDYRLPLDPVALYGAKFSNWIDYLGIDRTQYYELTECKKIIKEKTKNITTFNKDDIIKQLCDIDPKMPYYDIILDFYKLKNITDLFTGGNMRKKLIFA